jgi:hypothetical protein
MPDSDIRAESRRRFLKFVSGSPLLAWPGFAALAADPIRWAPMNMEHLIASPKDAINVFDFEPGPAGRRARAGALAHRIARGHAAGRRPFDQGSQARHGAQGVATTRGCEARHAARADLT